MSNINTNTTQNTTIAISPSIKSEIDQFGTKGESYSEIIQKLLKSAKDRLLYDVLMDEKDTVPIEEALANAKKRWQE
jgi:predicted CopG family antitoxin